MSLDSLDSLFNVSELYQTFMGGSMSSFQPLKEVANIEVPIGTDQKLTGVLEGWTLWHLDAAGKKKFGNTKKNWAVTAGPAHIREVNKENAGKGLPALKENLRKRFSTKDRALRFIVKYTPQTLETKLGDLKIPPYLVPQILTVVSMIVGNTLPHAKDINLVTAVQRESDRLKREEKTVKQLVVWRATKKWGTFDAESPLRHAQYPQSNKRIAARLYFELIDFLGKKMVYDVTPDDAKAFLEYVKKRRYAENREDQRNLGPGILRNVFFGVGAMFNLAVKKDWCDENPFEELVAQMRKNAEEYDEQRKKDRKPHDVELLQALIRAAWNENKIMCFAFLLALLEGLRRCEILRAPGSCIRLKGRYPHVRVDETMVKVATEKRFVPISPGFNAWLPVFINILQLKKICPFSESRYDDISRRIRDQVGFERGGHNPLRGDWTQGNQGMEQEMSPQLRAWIEGHSEDVMRLNYDGDGSPEFLEQLETMFDPVSVLGYMPKAPSVEELKLCQGMPSKIGGRAHKKYLAKMEALRLENEKNESLGSEDRSVEPR